MKRVREHKGKSLLEYCDEYIVIDIESTGLMPSHDGIIEIGAIKISDGQEVNRFQQLIKPKFPIDEFISELTGITNEMLEDMPFFDAIGSDFINFIGDAILLGHNVNFDINFLYDALEYECGLLLSNDYVDLLRISRRLLPELQNHKLKTVVESLGIDLLPNHRSIADCEATWMSFEYIKSNYDIEMLARTTSYNRHISKLKASDIVATVDEFDLEHLLYNKLGDIALLVY